MGILGQLLVLAAVLLSQNASGGIREPNAGPCPALPHFDWNACPFEGCTYRQWTAHDVVPVYDTWKGNRREVARLAVGEKVNAITGVVITYKPGVIRLDEDVPDAKLKQGDVILTYTYHGEGETEACFKGKYYRFLTFISRNLRMGSAAVNTAKGLTSIQVRKFGGRK